MRYAVERYVADVAEGESRGLWFDEDEANRAIDFFEQGLTHTAGEYRGQPFSLRLFQKFIVWNLFGWKCWSAEETHRRRFRYGFLSLARGNGKTPFGAGLLNLLAWFDSPIVPRAQCYTFATKEEQAKIAWEEAKCQVQASPSRMLRDGVNVMVKNLHSLRTGAKLEPKGSDSNSSDGWIIHGALVDELHAWQEKHRGLKDKIDTAMKGNQPLKITITTAGDDTSDLWQEEYDWAVQIVTPKTGIDADDHFVFIAEIDKDRPCEMCPGPECEACEGTGVMEVDVLDESYWPQANPMLNEPHSPIKLDALRSIAAKARVKPQTLQQFKRYHANQLVASFYKLISPELWAIGNRPLPDLANKPCHLGFDWGWRNDLAALSALFPVDGVYYLKSWAWIPDECDRDLTAEPWASWIRDEWLTVTQGNTTDVDSIYQTMESVRAIHEVRSVAYDPNNAREFSTKCVNEWGLQTYDFRQNCAKYNEPTRGFVDALRDGLIVHGGNPLLAWCAGNLSVREDSNGYIMPAKNRSQDKIDPIVAAIMAYSECKFADNATETPRTFYETHTLELC